MFHAAVLAARNRQGGAGREHKTRKKKNHLEKSWLSGLAQSILLAVCDAPDLNKTRLTAKMHSRKQTKCSSRTIKQETRNIFLMNRRLEKRDIGGERREMCCNKEAVNGAFLNFLHCSFVWREKKTLFFSVTPAPCHLNGAVDVSLRVQYPHLHR